MTRPDRGWTLTAGTAAAALMGLLAAASMGTTTERALAAAPPPLAACTPQTTSQTDTVPAGAGVVGPNPDTSVSRTIMVSAPGQTWVRDVDVRTLLKHTYSHDVVITLTHAGRTVTLASGNPSESGQRSFADVYGNTLFDDQANAPAADFAYQNQVAAPALSPEGSLAAFNGTNPNGAWTLTVSDTSDGDDGVLQSWGLNIESLASAPATSQYTFENTTPIASFDNATRTSTLNVAVPAGQRIVDADLVTRIEHADPDDLDVVLEAPGAAAANSPRDVTVTSDNMNEVSQAFANVTWDDSAPAHVTDATAAAPSFQPEEAMAALAGRDPNGTWTLRVTDDTAIDAARVNGWRLVLTTTGGCATDAQATVAGPDRLDVGGTGAYTFTVRNASAAGANNARLALSVPEGLQVQGVPTVSGGTCTATPLGCTIGDMAPNATATVTVNLRATAAGTYSLVGTASTGQTDTAPGNNAATRAITVGGTTTPPPATTTPPPTGTPTANPPAARPTIGVRLLARNFSVKRAGFVKARVRLTSRGQITVQLRQGRKVVKRAVYRGKAGTNLISLRVGRVPGRYQMLITVKGANGATSRTTGVVTIRRR